MSISIGPALHPAHHITDLKTRRRDSALHELVRHAHAAGAVGEEALLYATLLLRERLGATAVGRGVAVPNARSLAVLGPRLLIGRSRRGIEWGAPDGALVHLVLLALSPSEASVAAHHGLVARAVAAIRPARVRQRLLESEDPEDAGGLLHEVLP